MNLEVFKGLRSGDMVESKNSDRQLKVSSLEGNFMKDADGMIWHYQGLKDRVFLCLQPHDFYRLEDLQKKEDPIRMFIKEPNWSFTPEFNSFYEANPLRVYDAIIHRSYFPEGRL